MTYVDEREGPSEPSSGCDGMLSKSMSLAAMESRGILVNLYARR